MARRRLYDAHWYLRICQVASCFGFIAVLAGWTTTEVGRQPWTVYGLVRTADSVSPSLTGPDVLLSLSLYVIVYLLIYPVGVGLMLRLVRRGPAGEDEQTPVAGGRPHEPFDALAPTAPERSGWCPRSISFRSGPRSSRLRYFSTLPSTASISAWACSTTSRPTAAAAT